MRSFSRSLAFILLFTLIFTRGFCCAEARERVRPDSAGLDGDEHAESKDSEALLHSCAPPNARSSPLQCHRDETPLVYVCSMSAVECPGDARLRFYAAELQRDARLREKRKQLDSSLWEITL